MISEIFEWEQASPIYRQDGETGLDLESYRRLVYSIQGLKVVDIPSKFCCRSGPKAPEVIFSEIRRRGANILVVHCMPCYGGLARRAPSDIRLIGISDLLLAALSDAGINELRWRFRSW